MGDLHMALDEVIAMFKNFYEHLYSSKVGLDEQQKTEFISKLNLPRDSPKWGDMVIYDLFGPLLLNSLNFAIDTEIRTPPLFKKKKKKGKTLFVVLAIGQFH